MWFTLLLFIEISCSLDFSWSVLQLNSRHFVWVFQEWFQFCFLSLVYFVPWFLDTNIHSAFDTESLFSLVYIWENSNFRNSKNEIIESTLVVVIESQGCDPDHHFGLLSFLSGANSLHQWHCTLNSTGSYTIGWNTFLEKSNLVFSLDIYEIFVIKVLKVEWIFLKKGKKKILLQK